MMSRPREQREAATTNDGWRQRAAERFPRASRAKADSRSDRFMKATIAIMGETGGTDFTVHQVVARSKTSLRAFYQHFGSKDELLLALLEEIMAQSTQTWRDETADLNGTDALRLVIERASAQPRTHTQEGINRALTLYNQHLAETRPQDSARVLSPLYQLIRDILGRGIAERAFRADLDVDQTAAIITQTILSALRMHSLGADLTGTPVEAGHLLEFFVRGIGVDQRRVDQRRVDQRKGPRK
jgi:AcrR family transcriptional regulator